MHSGRRRRRERSTKSNQALYRIAGFAVDSTSFRADPGGTVRQSERPGSPITARK
jgi:hypothetical protein